jgi:hypothetical protein
MGVLSAVTAATGPLPVARQQPNPFGPVQVAAVPATFVENPSSAVLPVQAKIASASLAPELSQSTAARLMVETVDGIELDNIPFTNDAAVLLDDLPIPEKPGPAPEAAPQEPEPQQPEAGKTTPQPAETAMSDLSHLAVRGYLTSREAAVSPASAQFTPPDPSLGGGD